MSVHAEIGGLFRHFEGAAKELELIVDEFEKQLALERQARESVQRAEASRRRCSNGYARQSSAPSKLFSPLSELKRQRGRSIT